MTALFRPNGVADFVTALRVRDCWVAVLFGSQWFLLRKNAFVAAWFVRVSISAAFAVQTLFT